MKIFTLSAVFLLMPLFSICQNFTELIVKGDEFYMNGDYETAISYFTKAIEKNPLNDTGYWYRGDANYRLEKYKLAISDFNKCIELNPGFWIYFKNKGDCYYYLNDFNSASLAYSESIKKDSTNSETWLLRARCYFNLKNPLACTDYKKAFDLGEKSAIKEADIFKCEWTKNYAQISDCPAPSSYLNIKVDAFTGAVLIGKGISISKYEFSLTDGNAYLTNNYISQNQEIEFKILRPVGFCENNLGEVFFGVSYSLSNKNGDVLFTLDDIYKNQKTGVDADYLKHLALKVNFSNLTINENYILNIQFFDKKSEAYFKIILPFVAKENTSSSNSISSSENTLAMGVATKSINTNIESFAIKSGDSDANLDIYKLELNKNYFIELAEISQLEKNASVRIIFISNKGEYAKELQLPLNVENGKAKLNFETSGLATGAYTVLIKLNDSNGNSFNIEFPSYLK